MFFKDLTLKHVADTFYYLEQKATIFVETEEVFRQFCVKGLATYEKVYQNYSTNNILCCMR
jgi:hypothetical protein